MSLLILAVIVVIAAVGLWSWRPSAFPMEFSIDRLVIKHGENATITIKIKNFDMKTHKVEYRFTASDRLLIHEGGEELLPRIGAEYVFNYTLGAADPSETKVFVIVGMLEEGISSATYPIYLSIYFDGEELEKTWNDLTLKVER